MKGTYPFELRYHYPHMQPLDKEIWERFIITNPNYFEGCDYDVAVGSEPPFSTIVATETGGDAGVLYKKKIDVVGYKGDKKYIIELKPRADARAVGQVRNYASLYKRDVDKNTELKTMIITDATNRDLLEFAVEMDTIVIAV